MCHLVSNKLSRRFYGPFKVVNRVGPVACNLALLASNHIDLTFHVSLLKNACWLTCCNMTSRGVFFCKNVQNIFIQSLLAALGDI
ncbi:hypothetical protein Lal_00021016 [Lupinus albus]|nr:hypothetical protein Lal_00021016 [Lupinus albus]